MTHATIEEILSKRIMVLDGAMGTMIDSHALDESSYRGKPFATHPTQLMGCHELLCITAPHLIANIHKAYLDAGADIIKTNSFCANAIELSHYQMQEYVAEINLAATKVARKAAKHYTTITPSKPRFVAGAVGPTSKICTQSTSGIPSQNLISFEPLTQLYTQQMTALVKGGVDLLLIETAVSIDGARAALVAATRTMEQCHRQLPIMLSVTITKSGLLLSGETLNDLLSLVHHYPIFSIGINCSHGASNILPHLRHLAHNAPCYISAHPNAGLPSASGSYNETARQMIDSMRVYAQEQLINIVGGCCGTTPSHIDLLAQMVANQTPRKKHNQR